MKNLKLRVKKGKYLQSQLEYIELNKGTLVLLNAKCLLNLLTMCFPHSWWYVRTPRAEAERILKSEGVDGSFLARDSEANPGMCDLLYFSSYVMTYVMMKHDPDIDHISVMMLCKV